MQATRATAGAVVVTLIPDGGADDVFVLDGPEETAVERVKDYLRSIDYDRFDNVRFTVRSTTWIILTQEGEQP